MRMPGRLGHVVQIVMLAALLVGMLPAAGPTLARAQGDVGCADFVTQDAAQIVLDLEPDYANTLDPDGDGRACDDLPARGLPNDTPDPNELLGLGGTRTSFEEAYGQPVGIGQGTFPDGYDYVVPGYTEVDAYIDPNRDIVIYITLIPEEPLDLDAARAAVEPLLPNDAVSIEEGVETEDGDLIDFAGSDLLGGIINGDLLSDFAIPGQAGQFHIVYRIDRNDAVAALEIALGNGTDLLGGDQATMPRSRVRTLPEPNAAARLRGTESPTGEFTGQERDYLEAVGRSIDGLVESSARFTELIFSPEDTTDWTQTMLDEFTYWSAVAKAASDVEPPERFVELHEQYLEVTLLFDEAGTMILDGADSDGDRFAAGVDMVLVDGYAALNELDAQLAELGF